MRVCFSYIVAAIALVTCAPVAHAESSKKLLAAITAEKAATKFVGTKSTPTYANRASPVANQLPTEPSPTATSQGTRAEKQTYTQVASVDQSTDESERQSPVTETAPAQAAPEPVRTQLKASINLNAQTMTVLVDGATKHVFKISSGRSGYRTPTGTWRAQWMSRMHYSKKYDNAPMPHSVFFHKGFAIHATYATRRLGAPASHGCIRLSPSNAKKFYQLVQKYGKSNTQVSIHGVAKDRHYARKKKRNRRNTYPTIAINPFATPFSYKSKPRRGYSTRSKPYASGYGAQKKYAWPGD